jgi:protein SCO1/2
VNRAARFLLALSLAATSMLAPAVDPNPIDLKAGVFDPPQPAAEFPAGVHATDQGDLTLARWHGKVVLLVFGFTHCPAVCPTTLATLAQARKLLGPDAAAMQVVYVTVDPERDDLAHVRDYLAGFDRSFVGGTGQPPVLAELRRRYGATAQKIPPAGGGADYGMSHSTTIWLIDRAGRLRALMPFGHSAEDFAHDVRQLTALK